MFISSGILSQQKRKAANTPVKEKPMHAAGFGVPGDGWSGGQHRFSGPPHSRGPGDTHTHSTAQISGISWAMGSLRLFRKIQSAKGRTTTSRPQMVGWLPILRWAEAPVGPSVSSPYLFSIPFSRPRGFQAQVSRQAGLPSAREPDQEPFPPPTTPHTLYF